MTEDIIDTKIARREQTLSDLHEERRKVLRSIGRLSDEDAEQQLGELDAAIASTAAFIAALYDRRELEVQEQRLQDAAARKAATAAARARIGWLSRERVATAGQLDQAAAALVELMHRYRQQGKEIERETADVLRQIEPDFECRMNHCLVLLPSAGGRDANAGGALMSLMSRLVTELDSAELLNRLHGHLGSDGATFAQAAERSVRDLASLAGAE